jgi:hypothetical protein
MIRRNLADILTGANRSDFYLRWSNTSAADDYQALPSGDYVARIVSGELEASRSNSTPGYKLTFLVVEGEYAGRRFWHDIWLSDAALPMAKRDLGKIGVTDPSQLDSPMPPGIVCKVKLALRKDEDGTERNRVRSFDVIRVETPEVDPFHPEAGDGEGVAA